jgi:hypothetical protein
MNIRTRPLIMLCVVSSFILHPSSFILRLGGRGHGAPARAGRQLSDHSLHLAYAVPGWAGGRQRARAGWRDRRMRPGGAGDRAPDGARGWTSAGMPGNVGSGNQQALPGGGLPTTGAGLVGRGSCGRGAARAGLRPIRGGRSRTSASLAGPVAVVRVAGPRGRALRHSPGIGAAEGPFTVVMDDHRSCVSAGITEVQVLQPLPAGAP